MTIQIKVQEDNPIKVNVLGESFRTPVAVYSGDYEITPSDNDQILNTQGKQMAHNVTVHKIPSNYGKITWNGYVLRIT